MILVLLSFISFANGSLFLKSEFELGENYSAQNYSLDSRSLQPQDYEISGWNVSLGQSLLTTAPADTRSTTNNGALNFDLQLIQPLTVSLFASLSETKATQFQTSTWGGSASYSHDQNLGISYGLNKNEIRQKFELTLLGQLFKREVQLEQFEHSLSLTYSPLNSLNLQAGYNFFEYSKSKQDLAEAFQNKFLNNRATQIVFSIAGLPDSKFNVSAESYFLPNWSAYLNYSEVFLIADDRRIQDSEVSIHYVHGRWHWTLGVVQSFSESRTENLFLVQLGFDLI